MRAITILLCLFNYVGSSFGAESLDRYVDTAHYQDGERIPYVFTSSEKVAPKYILILMPGSAGLMRISQKEDGSPFFLMEGNFLIASRKIFSDDEIATISLDRARSLERMRAVIADIHSKYPRSEIYIVGTSKSTLETIYMAEKMDGEVAGFIHTSSMSSIGGLDTRNRKSRNLIVVHKYDSCRNTPPSLGIENHKSYGTEIIIMEGGVNEGDECGPATHHGYNGVREEVVLKIKEWIKGAG